MILSVWDTLMSPQKQFSCRDTPIGLGLGNMKLEGSLIWEIGFFYLLKKKKLRAMLPKIRALSDKEQNILIKQPLQEEGNDVHIRAHDLLALAPLMMITT